MATLGAVVYTESSIKIGNSTFDHNVAVASEACGGGDGFGGAIFFDQFQCDKWQALDSKIMFTNNIAQTAGGIMFFASHGQILPKCIEQLEYNAYNNTAPYGAVLL